MVTVKKRKVPFSRSPSEENRLPLFVWSNTTICSNATEVGQFATHSYSRPQPAMASAMASTTTSYGDHNGVRDG